MDISRDDLEAAVDDGVLSADEADALWRYLQARTDGASEVDAYSDNSDAAPALDLVTVAYYGGALIVMGAMGWFMTEALQQSAALLLPLALVYAALAGGAGYWLYFREKQTTPGGLLFTIAVSMTPVAVYGLQHAIGAWPADGGAEFGGAFHVLPAEARWVPMQVATLLAGAAVLRYVRFPFLTAPMAVAGWFLSVDLAALLLADPSAAVTKGVSVCVGLMMMSAALIADTLTANADEDFAFWGYLFGLLAFWGGLTAMEASSEWGRLGYFLINVGLIGCSLLLQRRVFLVFGALGAYGYLGYLSWDLFEDTLWFPFALTLLGASLIYGGVQYQRHRERIEAAARRWMQRRLPTGSADPPE
jgi:hypothetical protein